jgi:hypothetical protein
MPVAEPANIVVTNAATTTLLIARKVAYGSDAMRRAAMSVGARWLIRRRDRTDEWPARTSFQRAVDDRGAGSGLDPGDLRRAQCSQLIGRAADDGY